MRIVFVAPHPDDVEIMAGGQAIIYVREGHEVIELLMTKGEYGIFEEKYRGKEITKIREVEAKNADKIIGIQRIKFLGYIDHEITFNENTIQHIKNELEKLNPDIVYTPESSLWKTGYPSSDHLNTGKIVKEACMRMKSQNFSFSTRYGLISSWI